MTSPTPNLKEAIDDLTAKLKDHIEHEHPDPDMTKPCMFKQDVDDELLTLFDSALAAKDAECEQKCKEAKINAREKLLNKLIRTYTRITPPIKESPMELTDEAKHYNRFVEDLYKFADIEFKRNERALAQLYPEPANTEGGQERQ